MRLQKYPVQISLWTSKDYRQYHAEQRSIGWNEDNLPVTYPEIERLVRAIKQHNLQFVVEPQAVEFADIYYRHVIMQAGDMSWRIPVEDEDRDLDDANPVWLLDRVLRECAWFETSEDYLVWAKELGLDASSETVRDNYFQLREVSPQIKAYLGADVQALPEYDASNNTSVMQALRTYGSLK